MNCPKCNALNPDGVQFCATCGAPLAVQQAPPQPPVQPQYQQPVQPVQAPEAAVPGKGLGIASMVLGIVSLVLFCTSWFAVACSIVGIVLGIVGLNKAKSVGMKNGMALAGIICSAVALGILLILILFVGAAVSLASYM